MHGQHYKICFLLENKFIGLFDIVVDEQYRNMGFGKQLVINLLKHWFQ
jgi:ribosomal protein S18 acetylase RimI-like enzyme